MIEYALLVMLGFCAAGLLALLIAPTIWNRAVRLTTKRLDATLPMSLSDIEAGKDLLRASYAVQIRRLEAGLNKARDKSASQLVEISKLQMTIGEFRDQIGTLERHLEERRNAANVFERTIKKRFPELEAALAAAKSALDERAYEITDINNKLHRKDEALTLAQRAAGLQQSEIRRLRETLENSSGDRTGRSKKRPAQWSLEEFRSEYDRLNLEMSKLREQLALGHERETSQIAVLRTELQNLAEQIMASVAVQEKQTDSQRAGDTLPPPGRREPTPRKRSPADRPLSPPQPWPRGAQRQAVLKPAPSPTTTASPGFSDAQALAPGNPAASDPSSQSEADEGSSRSAEAKRPSVAVETQPGSKPETSAALKTLLDRAAAVAQKDKSGEGEAAGSVLAPPRPQSATASVQPTPESKSISAPRKSVAASDAPPATIGEGSTVSEMSLAQGSSGKTNVPEPDLDRMLREIFDSRAGTHSAAGEERKALPLASAAAEFQAGKNKTETSKAAVPSKEDRAEEAGDSDTDKKQSLLDRIRVM